MLKVILLYLMNNATLDKIAFPVYKLRSYMKIEHIDNITYVHTYYKSYVLDNKNLLGSSIGERRSRIKEGNIYPFKTNFKTPRDLVVTAKTGDVFCDNSGSLFKYKKSKLCDILCFKIKNKVTVNSKVIIHLEDFPTPFVIPIAVLDKAHRYITVVKYGEYFFLYSLEKAKVKHFKKRL